MKEAKFSIQNINEEYRHLIGGYSIGLSELEENIEKIINQSEELLISNKKIILAIPYSPFYENSFAYLLKLLVGKLIIKGKKKTSLIYPQTDLDISRKFSDSFSDAELLLIHNLPQHQSLISLLESDSEKRQIIIATGEKREWENLASNIPVVFYSGHFKFRQGFDLEGVKQAFQETIYTDLEAFENLSDWQKEAVFITSSFDFLGVPLPFDLLLSLLETNEDKLSRFIGDESQSFLYETEADFPPTFLVTTKSPEFAKQLLEKIVSESSPKLSENYSAIINSVESDNKDERYSILNLFQTTLTKNVPFLSRAKWRNLIKNDLDKLREIWFASDKIEHLLWGKVLEDFQLFKYSAEVFSDGLKSNFDNPYLLQAQARMYGNWALVEPSQIAKAEELFRELINKTATNPYFLQAQGVFETRRENFRKARIIFKDALNVAQGEEIKAYILTAWADMEIEQGNFATAEKRLSEISFDSKSVYLPHIRAKLEFYRGNYDEALKSLKEILSNKPNNVESWNLIGEIGSKRGHFQIAETALEKALKVSPENVPSLRSLGDLEVDLERIEVQKSESKTASETSLDYFDKAETRFDKALEIEPLNFFVQISRNVLLRYKGSLFEVIGEKIKAKEVFDKAEKNLRKLQSKFKGNDFITHNLGELFYAKGELKEAQRHFEYLRQTKKSIPNLVGLAKTEISLGNIDKAKQLLEEAEELLDSIKQKHFERIRSLNSLAEIWLGLKELDKADKLVNTALKLDEENVFTLNLLAKIKGKLRQFAEAEDFEKKTIELIKQDLEIS